MRLTLFLADRYSINTDPSATVTFTFARLRQVPSGVDDHDLDDLRPPGHERHRMSRRPRLLAASTWRARVNATVLHRTQSGRYDTATRQSVHLR